MYDFFVSFNWNFHFNWNEFLGGLITAIYLNDELEDSMRREISK